MIYGLILLGFSQFGAVLVAYWLFTRYIEAKQAAILSDLQTTIHTWIDAPPDGRTPSQLQTMLAAMGSVVGSAAAQSILCSFNQTKSSVAEVANGLSDEMGAQQNPLAGLLSGRKRGKGAAIARLVEIVGPMLGGLGGGGTPVSSRSGVGNHQGNYTL